MPDALVARGGRAMVPGKFGRLGAKRRLKRNESQESREVEIARVHCIRGGVRKAWLVLPLREYQGRQCVVISGSAGWLVHVLEGTRRSTGYAGAIANFVRDCVAKHAQVVTDVPATGAASSQALVATGSAEPAGRKKRGRSKILDSDDEQELGGNMQAMVPRRQSRAKRPRMRRGQFVTADIRGMQLQFTVLQGPRVLVQMDEVVIHRIVTDLLPRRDELREASSQDMMKEDLVPLDKGRVKWSAGRYGGDGSWVVWYQDSCGSRRRFTSGLSIPRLSLAGDPLTAEEQHAAGRQKLIKARREWNRLDASELQRYDFF